MRPSTKFSIVMLAALSVSTVANAGESLVFDSPSYKDVASLNMHPAEDDSARVKAIHEAGMSIGASGGFLEKTKAIFARYCLMPDKVTCEPGALDRSRALDGIFMFRPLVDERGFLPPVISEISGSADITENKMVVSGKVYRIVRPARFVQGVMTWRDYLMVGMDVTGVDTLPQALDPKTGLEKAEWADAVRRGWIIGLDRADAVFNANVDRLKFDYLGMLRFKRLRALGLVNEPVIAHDVRAAVVSGSEHASDVETSEIMTPALMEQDPNSWKSGLRFSDIVPRIK